MPDGKARGGIETLLHCMTTPFSLAPPGRSSRGHFPAAPSAGWSSEGMAIAPAFVASIGVLVMTRRGDEYRRRAKTCFDAAHATENEQTRAALLRLAEDWLRMAEGWNDPLQQQPNKPGPYSSNSSRSSYDGE